MITKFSKVTIVIGASFNVTERNLSRNLETPFIT